jgi:hypothetical protein
LEPTALPSMRMARRSGDVRAVKSAESYKRPPLRGSFSTLFGELTGSCHESFTALTAAVPARDPALNDRLGVAVSELMLTGHTLTEGEHPVFICLFGLAQPVPFGPNGCFNRSWSSRNHRVHRSDCSISASSARPPSSASTISSSFESWTAIGGAIVARLIGFRRNCGLCSRD